ncbi:RrF2 family transcriptional regulator [Extensimonas sp. H3M7-6]|uniref:RrF2 family transcriptional regulator n=1 Tax=Extensimonas soli TaxID=3031322 RepID=UPI0023DA83DA|nr:Rrf2 family transcriptional regulator [Extensimonas sp. H3M7-6]MDF1481656.1 Rrf2 family transcriptional regulator [Extensimonas sp. H3M7-6]
MRLTQWTDYSLRVLMYCAIHAERAQPVTITEIAEVHGISRSHLMKIVQELSARGLLDTTRGRGGGVRLLQPAQVITVGAVARATETDFALVECFDAERNQCRLRGRCRLQGVLEQALAAYLAVLDGVTLADLVAEPQVWQGVQALPMPFTSGAGAAGRKADGCPAEKI